MEAKYYGQRLKAKDVLRLYAAGERDFRGTILRGCNFRGADLSGADFSGADIRSARFVDATLRGGRFCGAEGGLQRRWVLVQLFPLLLVAALAGFLQGLAGALISFYLSDSVSAEHEAAGIAGLIIVVATFVVIVRQGFTLKALGSISMITVGIMAFVVATNIEAGTVVVAIVVAVAFTVAITGAISVSVTGAIAITISFAGIMVLVVAGATSVIIAGVFARAAVIVTGNMAGAESIAVAIATAGVCISSLLYVFNNRQTRNHNPKFENLRTISLAFSAMGGTSFSGAELTDAYFTNAILKGARHPLTEEKQPT